MPIEKLFVRRATCDICQINQQIFENISLLDCLGWRIVIPIYGERVRFICPECRGLIKYAT